MKILIITSCTSKKKFSLSNCLKQEDFSKGLSHIKQRENELKEYFVPAEELYTGQQHKKIMQAVNYLRKNNPNIELDLYILSAGYGLIKSNKQIVPYECTFSTMKKTEILKWANFLKIPEDIYSLMNNKYNLVLFALGDKYLEACNFKPNAVINNKTIFFCSYKNIDKLPKTNNVLKIPLGNNEARQYKCNLIGLKGELIARILTKIANSNYDLKDSMFLGLFVNQLVH